MYTPCSIHLNKNVGFYLEGDWLWRISGVSKHLCINESNYFIYQWAGPNTDGWLSLSIQLLHFDQADRCLIRSLWVFIEQSEGLWCDGVKKIYLTRLLNCSFWFEKCFCPNFLRNKIFYFTYHILFNFEQD